MPFRFPVAFLVLAISNVSAHAADANHGKVVFNQCRACHPISPGANLLGPNLLGVFERTVGTIQGFPYSPAYLAAKNKEVKWTEENLMEYLADPSTFLQKISGDKKARTKMIFRLPKETDRKDVIEYLKSLK